MYVRLKVTISLYLSPNSRTKQMHRTWCDTERQCLAHCGMPPVLVVCYVPSLAVEVVMYTSLKRL